ncbi:AAA family ATPase [Paenibacillus xylanilyticus]|uniref:AAA domain-containing protein n=1 Tax=Paenibacillus xylanilyticus TaxID=248903 RepID=A0A7Y6BVF7_9BACL|nr:AAA family ATPase [Paenibacillus xylanilyticus]NUU74674.1 AAA domain-containing protein [Paenibacillus xylanilyticus]
MKNIQYSQGQLNKIIDYLHTMYFERDEIIHSAFASIIAGEHMLLIGPPGTAKSSVLEMIFQHFRDLNVFKWTMNDDTTPDELLGPYEEGLYTHGKLKRKTVGKLPEAHMAILDEILRARGYALNSLLDILNERSIIQMNERQAAPLISLFGATNDLHENHENTALYDRFLIRINVDYLSSKESLKTMLLNEAPPEIYASLSFQDITQLKIASSRIQIPPDIMEIILSLRFKLFENKIFPSDRRLKSSLKLIRASALLGQRSNVEKEDLQILKHVLWNKPAEIDKLNEILNSILNSM